MISVKESIFGRLAQLESFYLSLPRRRQIAVLAGTIFAASLLLLFAAFWAYSYWYWNFSAPKPDGNLSRNRSNKEIKVDVGEPKTESSPLNGILYTEAQADLFLRRRPLAVMINNHVDARPQFGLSEADIIYEAVAEGGITRFLAVFHSADTDNIGPVRSARVYYLDFAAELNAWFAHWGGSYMDDQDKAHQNDPGYQFTCNPEADSYAYINRWGIPSLDEMWLGSTAYWRDSSRAVAVEHTGFTSTSKLYNEAPNRYPEEGWQKFSPFEIWLFKDDEPPAARPSVASLSFGFWQGYPDYDVRWEYDPKMNDYVRYQGGAKQSDAGNNKELRAKNVIVQFTDQGFFNDKKNHLKYQTVGSGSAKIFLDGKIIEAEWRKASVRDRTRYFEAKTQEEIRFNRGQVWVEIVPSGNEITYTQ